MPFFQTPVTSAQLCPNTFLSVLFYTLSPCSSNSVRDEIPHPYKTTTVTTLNFVLIRYRIKVNFVGDSCR
jgi:hypothetical protein